VKQVVVPLDGSALAELALDAAARLSRPGATIHLLSVEEILPQPKEGRGVGMMHEGRMEKLEGFCKDLRRQGHKAKAILAYGNAAPEILKYAESVKADGIVMTSHGRTGLRRLVLGSVASAVAAGFPSKMVIVRPPRSRLRE
jgi:nucleotide-binding universal stress UspA family protein